MKTTFRAVIASAAAAVFGIAGCAVQPAQHADLPTLVQRTAPDAFSVSAEQDAALTPVWWSQFCDPVMHELIVRAPVRGVGRRVEFGQQIGITLRDQPSRARNRCAPVQETGVAEPARRAIAGLSTNL